MGSLPNRRQAQDMEINEEEQEAPQRRVISHGPNRIIGASGAAWIKPRSSQVLYIPLPRCLFFNTMELNDLLCMFYIYHLAP